MRYALLLLAAVLIVRSTRPVPTHQEIEQQNWQHAAELNQAHVLAARFTEELLGGSNPQEHDGH